jgi:hypothetical protein
MNDATLRMKRLKEDVAAAGKEFHEMLISKFYQTHQKGMTYLMF